VERLLTNLSVSGQKNARIVDLGCRTGKFTVLLAARPEQFEVVAAEPHEGVREELVRRICAWA
jgi:tRNA G46 methylase TrmB